MESRLLGFAVYLGLTAALSALAFFVFRSQFWSEVKCDNGEIATLIYNLGKVSSISNTQEVSFDDAKKLRTCTADVIAESRDRKIVFVIDTSERGISSTAGATKFAVSYNFAD
jgi:hypothetical protein